MLKIPLKTGFKSKIREKFVEFFGWKNGNKYLMKKTISRIFWNFDEKVMKMVPENSRLLRVIHLKEVTSGCSLLLNWWSLSTETYFFFLLEMDSWPRAWKDKMFTGHRLSFSRFSWNQTSVQVENIKKLRMFVGWTKIEDRK